MMPMMIWEILPNRGGINSQRFRGGSLILKIMKKVMLVILMIKMVLLVFKQVLLVILKKVLLALKIMNMKEKERRKGKLQ